MKENLRCIVAAILSRPLGVWTVLALGYMLLGIVLYFPALGNSLMLLDGATAGEDYVMQLYGWQSLLQAGKFPFWNPYLFFGVPMVGSYAFCPFYPSQWLYFLLPHNAAFTMQYVFALAVGGVCMVAWARTLGLRMGVAVWSGFALIASGHFLTLTYGGRLQEMIAIAWVPGVWAAWTVLSRRCMSGVGRCCTASGLMALCLSMQLLAGGIQVFYGTLAVCVAHLILLCAPLVYRAWTAPEPGLRTLLQTPAVRALTRIFVWFAACLILTILLSAPQLFHGLEVAKSSVGGVSGVPYAVASEASYPPTEMSEYLVAQLWGERMTSDFVGLPIVLLAALALLCGARRERWFWIGVFGVSTLVAFGLYTPVHRLCYAVLPWFDRFRMPCVWMFLGNFALLILAAFGLDYVLRRLSETDEKAQPDGVALKGLRLLLTVFVAVGLVATIVGFVRNFGVKLDIATATEAAAYRRNLLMITLGLQVAVSCGLVGLALARLKGRGTRLNVILVQSGVAVAVVAVLIPLCTNRSFIRYDYLDRYMEFLQYQRPYAELQRTNISPRRMIDDRRERTDQMISAVAAQEGHSPVVLQSYADMLTAVGFASERFGQLMGVNYQRTGNASPPVGTWQPVYSTLRESLWKWASTQRPYTHNSVNLIEATDERMMTEVTARGRANDFAVAQPMMQKFGLQAGMQMVKARLNSWEPGHVSLEVESGGGNAAVLPVAEPYALGWRARLADGTRLKVLPVNHGLLGVRVPGGVSPQGLTLTYDPQSLRVGIFVCWLTIFALIFRQSRRIAAWLRQRQ